MKQHITPSSYLFPIMDDLCQDIILKAQLRIREKTTVRICFMEYELQKEKKRGREPAKPTRYLPNHTLSPSISKNIIRRLAPLASPIGAHSFPY